MIWGRAAWKKDSEMLEGEQVYCIAVTTRMWTVMPSGQNRSLKPSSRPGQATKSSKSEEGQTESGIRGRLGQVTSCSASKTVPKGRY